VELLKNPKAEKDPKMNCLCIKSHNEKKDLEKNQDPFNMFSAIRKL